MVTRVAIVAVTLAAVGIGVAQDAAHVELDKVTVSAKRRDKVGHPCTSNVVVTDSQAVVVGSHLGATFHIESWRDGSTRHFEKGTAHSLMTYQSSWWLTTKMRSRGGTHYPSRSG